MTTNNAPIYCVVYRVGGTEVFQWQRTLPMTYAEAQAALAEITRGGRVGHIANYARSVSIGLPETYDAATPIGFALVHP